MSLSNNEIKKLKKGDAKAFESLHNSMFASLCLYGKTFIKHDDIINDIVHEAFISLWYKKEDFDTIYQIKGYLYTIVKNKLLTHIRLDKTESIDSTIEIIEEQAEVQLIKDELYKSLFNAINSLPEQTQNIIKLKVKGLTNNDIAEQLNISINTVKTLLKSGYKKLRELLKDNALLLILLTQLLMSE